MQLYLPYAGIGSRQTPEPVLQAMTQLARVLARKGFTLRSGHAQGADQAFEEGCNIENGSCEIFLPWRGFEGSDSDFASPTPEAVFLAETVHKAYKYVSHGAQKLIARNMHQILGRDLKQPSRFVLCWTPDGCINEETYTKQTGGTGSAIALASRNNIPVFNLYNEPDIDEMFEFFNTLTKSPQEL